MLTIYGRKPVLEAISDPDLLPKKLHLSSKNRPADILEQIVGWAERRKVEIREHPPASLSRISKNAKQDQGVALDLECPSHQQLDDFLQNPPDQFRILALDGITNPQNLGMVIRSVTASPLTGLLLSKKDSPRLSPLVIKSSAGTLFKAPLLRTAALPEALKKLSQLGAQICVLDSNANSSFEQLSDFDRVIYVLGNETDGISRDVAEMATHRVSIQMNRGVESLNVAVTAALVAFS